MKKTNQPPTAEAIAKLAESGKPVSGFFTAKGKMMRPKTWSMTEARAKFYEVLRLAERDGPQKRHETRQRNCVCDVVRGLDQSN